MLLLLVAQILMNWPIEAIPVIPLNMYELGNHFDGYCLSYHMRQTEDDTTFILELNSAFIPVEQMMSYCLRPSNDIGSNFEDPTQSKISFADLKKKNISTRMLFSWSASIDLAERYEIFLNNDSNSSTENQMVFYNCTGSWFGLACRFTFDSESNKSFNEIVDGIFRYKYIAVGDSHVTCYVHLTCQTVLSCLDWREICDGKQDCFDGADEENCWQLEMNECADDEYRCMNGQCIPWEFYQNGLSRPDCSDRTDERRFVSSYPCFTRPTLECEEYRCRPGEEQFACGDGQCVEEMYRCINGRKSFLPMNFCTNMTLCYIRGFFEVDRQWCELYNSTDNCSISFEFRKFPILFGHVRFIVSNATIADQKIRLPDHVCYNATLCPHLTPSTKFFENLTCQHLNSLGLPVVDLYTDWYELVSDTKQFFHGCLINANAKYLCNSSTMYQCMNSSKCIAKYRLLNSIRDCPFGDDETSNESCSLRDIHQRSKCLDEHEEKCFTLLARNNGKQECRYGEDEYEFKMTLVRTHISFQTICDGLPDLLPVFIDGRNETDETECELWQCNNTYTRCDGFWSCKHGEDEVDCSSSICKGHYHHCVLPHDFSNMSCLPMTRFNDGIDDCICATDEHRKSVFISYGTRPTDHSISNQLRCRNDSSIIRSSYLCNGQENCPLNDDEVFCKNVYIRGTACSMWLTNRTDVEKFLCEFGIMTNRYSIIVFKLRHVLSYPAELIMKNGSIVPPRQTISFSAMENQNEELSPELYSMCHRGIPFRVRMSDNTSKFFCLCPPSYYGDQCQYQNERVSLIVHARLTSDWRQIFVFLVTLIDDKGNIESHEHIEYVPGRDCPIKYSIYLLYATRPKNTSRSYSVRIDAFTRMTLNYRASWLFPLRFPFLPVQHLAVLLRVPFSTPSLPREKCSSSCIHGQCSTNVNDPTSTFCHCESGWSGLRCDIELKCACASNSICISNAICLCPPGRWGRRCHLSHSMDGLEACINGGERAPVDARYLSNDRISSVCICPEGYIGDLCEHEQEQTQIDISFHPTLSVPPSLLVHFIAVRDQENVEPNRTSIAKKLQFDQTSLTVYTITSFNIAIAQTLTEYYLIILREETITAAEISTEVIPNHRCQSISELFNETFSNQHLLKRIKSYHLPCQRDPTLICFFDDIHMCLCTLDQRANCFEFDHKMTYECEKAKYCGNQGQCFQDAPECPTSSFCACHRCYFGSRCQFSTKGSTLSLDIILGYHIHSKMNIQQQPTIVKIAILLTTIVFVAGMINGFLSLRTFRREETRNVGCGLYLFTVSILSMIIVLILTLKFAFLLASQIGSIEHRWFLRIQCTTMDFLLRSLLSISDWLSACVALERLVSAIQGVKFNKAKSQRVARWMILIIVLSTSCSYVYDPVHRQLLDDEEEQRTWCVTQYSSLVQIIDWIMNIFHFSVPFVINAISALIVILVLARTRLHSQKKKSFRQHLHEQFHQHKHLFISPVILIILALPRLVLSFLAGCMGSARESWLYLSGYYISFIPAIMTLIVFILPSALYKKEFYETMKRIGHR